MPTPPPMRDNCRAELIERPIAFISSVTEIKKHDTNSPRRLRPAFKKKVSQADNVGLSSQALNRVPAPHFRQQNKGH